MDAVPVLAFCPFAPVLVPAVAQGAAPETADVLAACDDAVARLAAGGGRVLVVGPGPVSRGHDGSATGTFAGFGVPVTAGAGTAEVPTGPQLPLSLSVGAWLLDRAGVDAARRDYVQVGASSADDGPPGLRWPDADTWLVMGDGTARLSERAPGGYDPRAAGYDETAVAALASGDPAVLAGLDPHAGADLLAAGAPVWQAVGSALLARHGSGRRWQGTVTVHAAPYGVSYVVAVWA